ncbi:MAG: hypothetical protein ABI186_01930 [Candidatus Elarobacter sp.]
MDGFGDLFGSLGELLGGLAEARGGRGAEGAVESSQPRPRGEFDDPMTVGRYLTGAKRVLNINDI